MGRKPDIKSKTDTVTFKPTSIEDMKVSEDFKKLVTQDGVTVHDLMLEAFALLFKVHHWPPGNPQLTLETSLLPLKQFTPHCKCGQIGVHVGVHVSSGRDGVYCKKCFVGVAGRHDRKVWSWKGELP